MTDLERQCSNRRAAPVRGFKVGTGRNLDNPPTRRTHAAPATPRVSVPHRDGANSLRIYNAPLRLKTVSSCGPVQWLRGSVTSPPSDRPGWSHFALVCCGVTGGLCGDEASTCREHWRDLACEGSKHQQEKSGGAAAGQNWQTDT